MEIAMIDLIFYLTGASLVTFSLIFYYYWKDRNKLVFDEYLESYLIDFTEAEENYVIRSNSKSEKLINAGEMPAIVHFFKLSMPIWYSSNKGKMKKTKYICVLTRLYRKEKIVKSSAIPCDRFGRFKHHNKTLGSIHLPSDVNHSKQKYLSFELENAEHEMIGSLGYHLLNQN